MFWRTLPVTPTMRVQSSSLSASSMRWPDGDRAVGNELAYEALVDDDTAEDGLSGRSRLGDNMRPRRSGIPKTSK